jgi:hypothetical protein
MNTQDQQLKNYLKIFSCVAMIPILFFGFLGYILEPVIGDLTRIGKLAERDFGWNEPQPIIQIRPSSSIEKPDVIVIGDSFSEPNVWQSVVMQKTTLSLLTFSHLTMRKPECIGPWLKSIPARYPSAKTIIIETTEKSFLSRFTADPKTCKSISLQPHSIAAASTLGMRPNGYKDIMPDPIYALRAALNMRRKFDNSTRSSDTIIEPLDRTNLFSNRRSDLLLFYKGDVNQNLAAQTTMQKALASILSMQEAASKANVRLIINVVPDKSSIYSRYFKQENKNAAMPNAQQAMAERGIPSIDLFTPFNANVEKIIDLYLPNDTHLSTRGYILMGETVAKALSEF